MHWLAGGEAAIARPLRAGDVLPLRNGESISAEPATEFAGGPPSKEGSAIEGAFSPVHNGFYLLRGAGGTESWIAVNTFDDDTSDLSRVATTATLAGAPEEIARPYRAGFLRAWPPWVYLAAAALFLSALEWMLYHRRRTE